MWHYIFRGAVTLSNRPGLFELSMPDDDQHTLKLYKVKSIDAGQLTCVASNKYGSDSCILTLEMAGTLPFSEFKLYEYLCYCRYSVSLISLSLVAPTFESIMEDLDVNVGETPRFAVVVEGKPVPDILWYKVCAFVVVHAQFN